MKPDPESEPSMVAETITVPINDLPHMNLQVTVLKWNPNASSATDDTEPVELTRLPFAHEMARIQMTERASTPVKPPQEPPQEMDDESLDQAALQQAAKHMLR